MQNKYLDPCGGLPPVLYCFQQRDGLGCLGLNWMLHMDWQIQYGEYKFSFEKMILKETKKDFWSSNII